MPKGFATMTALMQPGLFEQFLKHGRRGPGSPQKGGTGSNNDHGSCLIFLKRGTEGPFFQQLYQRTARYTDIRLSTFATIILRQGEGRYYGSV
jgi:hypothetical protein